MALRKVEPSVGDTGGSAPQEGQGRVQRWALRVFVLMLFLALLGPDIIRFHSSLLGIEEVDHYGTQWFYWFVGHQLRIGEGIDTTNLFFYPYGKDILLHTGANVLDAYLALPFRALFGHVLGYNLFVVTALVLSAVAFHRLAREWTRDAFAAGVSTLLFALSPYILYETAEGRPTQAILGVAVLFVLFTIRSGRGRGVKAPAYAGLALAVLGYQYWYYAFFGGMVCLAHGIYRFVSPAAGSGGRWRILGRHVLIAAVAFVLVAPMAVPMARLSQSDSSTVPGLLNTAAWSLSSHTPTTIEGRGVAILTFQPWYGQNGFYVEKTPGQEQYLPHQEILSWIALVLILIFLVKGRGEEWWLFVVMGGMAVLIAVGPLLVVAGHYLPNPLYIYLAKSIGVLQRLWWPARAIAFLVVMISLACGSVIAMIGSSHRLRQVGVSVLILLLWCSHLVENKLLPFPMWDATVPAGYRCLADGPEGALIELPYGWTQAHLYYQTTHERPILGGMIENNPLFTPPSSLTLRQKNTYLKAVMSLGKLDRGGGEWTAEDKQAVQTLGYRYVVIQQAAYQPSSRGNMASHTFRVRLRRMRRKIAQILGDSVYEDANIAVYAPWGDPAPCDVTQLEKEVHTRPRQNDASVLGYGNRAWIELVSVVPPQAQPSTPEPTPGVTPDPAPLSGDQLKAR